MRQVENRTIFNKDNLDVLRGINTKSIDLIYLDPPFNKKKLFTAPIGSSAEGAEFSDIFRQEDVKDDWLKDIEEDYIDLYLFLDSIRNISDITKNKHYLYNYCYLCYMAIRLIEMHRVLKDIGSIYLHCDPTMSHYLKILLDIIFGEKNFRNEITWQRNDKRGKGSQFKGKKFGNNTDIIFFYTKSDNFNFRNTEDIKEGDITKKFNKVDKEQNRYYTGIPIFCSKSMGDRPNLCYEWKGFKNPYPSGWRLSKERLEEEYKKGNVVITKNKTLERRMYLEDYEGYPIDNNWIDIPRAMGREYVGYPTQKPLKLLERIIKASSNEGDIVLDPFCGCATTCIAAERLNREWIGIDVSVKAFELVKKRIKSQTNLFDFNTDGINYKTDPPLRTDTPDENFNKKFVYIISNKQYRYYKIGIAKDWKSRLNSYQTADPNRAYKMEYKVHTIEYRKLEKHLINKFKPKGNKPGEWVDAELKDIIKEIDKFLNK